MNYLFKISSLFLLFSSTWLVDGQDTSLCDKYTTAVFGNNTADNELALIQAVVNMAVLGDGTSNLPGILAPDGGLLELFDGSGPTTNRGGSEGVVVNFLDGASGLPDNLDSSTNTAFLLNHLYQFFGALLGCSASDYPSYQGVPDMFEVHKFMNINKTQTDFFIQQVGGAAAALGVSEEDVGVVASVLDGLFNQRCVPPLTLDSDVPDFMVGTDPSICQTEDCTVANATFCEATDSTPTATPDSGTTAAPTGASPTSSPTSGSTPAPTPTPSLRATERPSKAETPSPTSTQTICEKYTIAVFENNTADNELALVQAVVNMAVLGDGTSNLPGILAPAGGLLELFNGSGPTTNRGGSEGIIVNFLDGDSGLPDHLDSSSNTAFLLNHLYQFFGALLGCTANGYPSYQGVADMYEVHKFMNINKTQTDYFIQQVGGAASALGVTEDDVGTVASVLDGLFNMRCTPPLDANSGVPSFMVGTDPSICQTSDCPVADESACKDEPSDAPTPMPAKTPQSQNDSQSGASKTATIGGIVAVFVTLVFI